MSRKKLAATGENCNVHFQPCCHRFEHDVFNGKFIVHFQKTVFSEQNEIIRNPQPSIKLFDGTILDNCPYCKATINFTKDVSKMITWYGTGLNAGGSHG